ncbi:MAG: hypothetical protein J7E03_06975 [Escherichia coli]|nr:hypothetical protein [Escherichia coli]
MATEITTIENTNMAPTITAKPVMAMAFDTTTREGKKRLFNALNTAESLNDADIKQLTLTGIIVRPTERQDQATGEVVMREGTTFITEQGAYFTQSDGIACCAKNLIMAYGSGFADEPITIEFTERKLGGGRTLKQFIVL